MLCEDCLPALDRRVFKMKETLALFTTALSLLAVRASGTVPNNGYCIREQCFAAFQDPADFSTAQTRCAETGGHLMTVRSSVSHDSLSILFGRLSGECWIGLHLLSGCPTEGAPLQGYEWVTGDSESDFHNWAAIDRECAPKCVSVSKVDDFKWKREYCDKKASGFLCEYSFRSPCERLPVSQGETVFYTTPYGFGGEDVLSLPPDSKAVGQPSGAKYVCSGETWKRAPWTCEIDKGGCEHQCMVDPQQRVPVCVCPQGQALNPDNNVTCEEVKADPCVDLRCEGACHQRNDSYACMCDHGFELAEDGRTCKDIDDCSDERLCPGDNFQCINTIGGFQCVCQKGYKLLREKCVDIDECDDAPCQHMCTNVRGSYECSCFEGYIVDPDKPDTCTIYCGLKECPAMCDPNNNYLCMCQNGYIVEERGTGMFCIDIDECDSNQCEKGCRNTYGGFVCSCPEGFHLVNGYKCETDEDDKEEGTGGWEGSGVTTPYFTMTPSVKYTDPTSRPSTVTVGGLLAIIMCTVFVILLAVCLGFHIYKRQRKIEIENTLKAQGNESHGLERVTTEMHDKT